MLRAVVMVLACLYLVRTSPAEPYNLRFYAQNIHNTKDINSLLSTIEERLRVLDSVSVAQTKQARRLDDIENKLDRVENTLSLKLERAQLAAERLEHRLHMLQVNVQTTIKESTEKLERSQAKIAELAQNLTKHIDSHKHLLEKVNGAYADTWHRGLVLESLMRDGLSLVNVTRRELADGLRALARRQRDARKMSADLEANFEKRLNENTFKIDIKMKDILETQKRFVDTCQRVQQDDPTHVADVLEKFIDSFINKTESTFHVLQSIQTTLRNHDSKVVKLLSTAREPQNEATCRRLEGVFKNQSHSHFKENELRQLTEKFVALTDRADAALQKLEAQLADDPEDAVPSSEVTAELDNLWRKLDKEHELDEESYWENGDKGYFHDSGGGDIMAEDKLILNQVSKKWKRGTESIKTHQPHRRHLHRHPYDRGPMRKNPIPK